MTHQFTFTHDKSKAALQWANDNNIAISNVEQTELYQEIGQGRTPASFWVKHPAVSIHIVNETDAMAFKLRWCDA